MMTRPIPLLLLALALSTCDASANPQPNSFSTRGWAASSGRSSPTVAADGRISFALHAPSAQAVMLQFGEWTSQRLPLARESDGWWTGTLGPVAPGLHTYTFLVDGFPTVDLLNPRVKAGTIVYGSVVEVPGHPPSFDALQDVAFGTEHILRYRSTAQQRVRTLHVYLPACYQHEPARRFPVLYLRHGGGDAEHSWLQDGRAGVILDNLLAAGKAEPMIIVTPNGLTDGSWAGGSSEEGMRVLERELLEDVIPLIEARYRTIADREHRALAGLSMGGGQAFVIGLRQLGSFAWVAQFSSGLLADRELRLTALAPALEHASEVNASLHLLWIGCGTADPRYAGHLNLMDQLRTLGIHAEFHASPGGHEWSVWREQLHELLPALFRARSAVESSPPEATGLSNPTPAAKEHHSWHGRPARSLRPVCSNA